MPEFVLHCGDCHQFLPTITQPIQAITSDPPFGCSNDCDYSRFSGGKSPSRNHHRGIVGDDQPFDPTPFLNFPQVVLFGFQHFAKHLPVGTTFVWQKKRTNQLGTFCSDAELAWSKGGHGVYLFQHVWNGFDRQTERGQKTNHPTQKPVALWRWVFEKLKLVPGQWVFDPFMGTGSSGVAAIEAGLNFIGCEIDQHYFEIADQRIRAAV